LPFSATQISARSWVIAGSIGTNGSYGSKPCENVRERRTRRIVFSIAFFRQPLPELLVLRLKKSKRTFYAQIERGSFRTASVESRPSARAKARERNQVAARFEAALRSPLLQTRAFVGNLLQLHCNVIETSVPVH
jgi:hypothetical protein